MMKMLTVAVVILAICSAGAFATYSVGKYFDDQRLANEQKVNSFEECANKGYTVMETHPEQCVDNNGNVFFREILD